ncbi:redox-sensing transcriptional repressor Rex [Nakamurella endophytica]|uniref:Redox-sensing transcriptional repressor Rex n=1 Tax=Nakamurella endophytica TaxID=1748367 RepID=A0A917WGW0_9ACTN|nr:redox-sensing transcriptional repressor Rex [Nakamurella endophytica]GGM04066.1 hypothetical protein GCM10011594_25350 [Nakamurella endophytica]
MTVKTAAVLDGGAPSAATSDTSRAVRSIPEATVARLATYLRVLAVLPADAVVSSAELAESAGVKPAGLRKDLSFLDSQGTRGVGYSVRALTDSIRRAIGAGRSHRVALAGLGNLGQALAGYAGFAARGLVIAALFDADPAKIGRRIGDLPIHDIADAPAVCRAEGVTIGIIATPEECAQQVADTLVRGGVRSVLDFAPGPLRVPPGVELRRVDLAVELQILAFHETRRASPVPAP